MKHRFTLRLCTIVTLLWSVSHMSAQQVSTIYFLENTPYRSVINPAFQPVSNFYLELPVLGYTSAWCGSNALSMQDLIYKYNGKTVTALYNQETQQALWNKLPQTILSDVDLSTNVFSFGFRVKQVGYFHLNVTQRFELGSQAPRQLFAPILGQSASAFNLSALGAKANVWTDIALGYSHQVNDKWSVGGKLKVLLGNAYAGATFDNFNLKHNPEQFDVRASGNMLVAGSLNWNALPQEFNLGDMSWASSLLSDFSNNFRQYLKPCGYGGAIDLGFTYKPISMLQISASVTDLGFMYWNNAKEATMNINASFNGVGEIQYSDLFVNGKFRMDTIIQRAESKLSAFADSISFSNVHSKSFLTRTTPKLNIGVDANFCNNIIGIGIYNRTRFYLDNIYNETTLGAAIRPCNWFNIAASYSFFNGRWGSMGAAIALAPYDGLMFTVAADYIPLSYVKGNNGIPYSYKTNGLNFAFGVCIVAGTNHNKKRNANSQQGSSLDDPLMAIPLEGDSLYTGSPYAVPLDSLQGAAIGQDTAMLSYQNDPNTPYLRRAEELLLQKAMHGIEFESGRATIKSTSYTILYQLASVFIAHTDYHIEVQGHTDNVGNPAQNRELSDKRAKAVRDFLIRRGVPSSRIEAHGYGGSKPIADNNTKAGRQENRRTTFVLSVIENEM